MSKQEELETKTKSEVTEDQAVACETETTETVDAPVEATEVTEVSETVQTDEITTPSLEQVQAELNEKTSIIAEMQSKLDEAEAAMKQKMAQEEEMKKKLDDTKAAMKKMDEEMKSMKKKELMAKRTASLLECGFEHSDIEESIAAYSVLDDDAFNAVVAVMKKKMAKTEDKMVKDDKKDAVKAESEFETTEEILEEVQETEALDLTVGGADDSEANTTSAALIDFVYSRLGKKLNKGE